MADSRTSGLDVEADTTPFNQGLGLMIGILPEWLIAGGLNQASQALMDGNVRKRLRLDCDRYWRFVHRGEWQRVRLQGSPQFPELAGLAFPDIAKQLGKDEWDCYFDILAAAGEHMGSLILIGELFSDEHLAEMISHPLFSLGVDQYSLASSGPLAEAVRNPLAFCGHVHYLSHHVARNHTLSLEEAVRKMTSMPARRFGLEGRGEIRRGHWADVAVLDVDLLNDGATFDDPVRHASGVVHVMVNGQLAVRNGEQTGIRSGRVLSRT